MTALCFVGLAAAAVYILYRQGLAVTKCIAARLFVFRPGREAARASLNRCTGWVRHAVRFRESRCFEFRLDGQLSEGDVEVALLDGKKRELLRLNRDSSAGAVTVQQKSRYYLRWEFRGASGKCETRWRAV